MKQTKPGTNANYSRRHTHIVQLPIGTLDLTMVICAQRTLGLRFSYFKTQVTPIRCDIRMEVRPDYREVVVPMRRNAAEGKTIFLPVILLLQGHRPEGMRATKAQGPRV